METVGLEITIIRASGTELTNPADSCQAEFFAMLEGLAQQPMNTILDLGGVTACNAEFMTSLYAAMAACRRANCRLVLSDLTPQLSLRLDSVISTTVLPRYPNNEAAAASFS